jgi:hypothetical protein
MRLWGIGRFASPGSQAPAWEPESMQLGYGTSPGSQAPAWEPESMQLGYGTSPGSQAPAWEPESMQLGYGISPGSQAPAWEPGIWENPTPIQTVRNCNRRSPPIPSPPMRQRPWTASLQPQLGPGGPVLADFSTERPNGFSFPKALSARVRASGNGIRYAYAPASSLKRDHAPCRLAARYGREPVKNPDLPGSERRCSRLRADNARELSGPAPSWLL